MTLSVQRDDRIDNLSSRLNTAIVAEVAELLAGGLHHNGTAADTGPDASEVLAPATRLSAATCTACNEFIVNSRLPGLLRGAAGSGPAAVETCLAAGTRERGRRRLGAFVESGDQDVGADGGSDVNWREASCGTVSLFGAEGKLLRTIRRGRLPQSGKLDLKRWLAAEKSSLFGRREDLTLVAVADGAPDNGPFWRRWDPTVRC